MQSIRLGFDPSSKSAMDEPSIKLVVNEEPVSNCQFAPSEPGSPKPDVEIERCEPVKIDSIIEEDELRTIAETDNCMLESEDLNLVIAAKNKENDVCTDFNEEELKSAATRVDDVVDSIIAEDELRTIAETDNCVLVPELDDQNTVIAVKNKDADVFTDVNEEERLPCLENSIHDVFNSKDGNFGVTDVKTKEKSFATGSQFGNVDAVVEEAHLEIYELKDTQLVAEVAKEGDVENKIVEETQKGENEDMVSKENNVDGIVEKVVEEAHMEVYELQESKLIKGVEKEAKVQNMIVEEQERTTTKRDEDEDMVSKEQETLIADTEMETETEVVAGRGRKRKRGEGNSNIEGRKTTRKTIGEDVCFICYDGGDLMLCDRRRCPKAYHSLCVNRGDSFFQSKGSWNCGWHLCSMCEEDAQYMCYTCTYSLCKRCMKDGDLSRVRAHKGFCETCMKTVMLIERNESGNGEIAKVDFDDKSSWEYLFKDYWSGLKGKLSLSSEEVIKAKKPRKISDVALGDKHGSPGGSEYGSGSGIPSGNKTCTLLKRKAKKRIKALTKEVTSASAADGALGDKQGSPVELYNGSEDGSGLGIPLGNKTRTPIKRKAKKRTKAITKEETSASASDVALRDKQESPVELHDANGGSGLDIPSGNKASTPIKRKAKKILKAITEEETSASASDVALRDKQESLVEIYDANGGSCLDIPSGNKASAPIKRKATKRKAITKEETSASASDVPLRDKQESPVELYDANGGSDLGIPLGNKASTPNKRKSKKRLKAITEEETSASASDVSLRDKQEPHVELYDANGGSGLDIPSGNKTSTPIKRKAKKRLKALTEEEISASASDVELGDKQGSSVELDDANGGSGLDIPLGNKTNTPIKRKAKKKTKAFSKEETSASASDVALGNNHGSPVELYDASIDGSGLDIPSANKTNTPVKRKVKSQIKALVKEEISASASDAALGDKQGYPVELYNANGDGSCSGSDIPFGNKTGTPLKRKDKKRIEDLTKEKITVSASENLNSSKSKRAKGKKRLKLSAERDSPCGVSAFSVEGTSMFGKSEWASKEVLDFVMHMKDGDTSVISYFEVEGLLFKYIKQNKLRDPHRESQIICDSTLQNLFGKQRVGHFELQKLLESHFLGRQYSQTYDCEGTVNTETSQLDVKDRKLKSRRKGDERGLQSNVDDYAAVDTNNINLVYLRRNVMEALLDDFEYFHHKVVGCFVRIRILGDDQKQEMYRLVQVVGTCKADTMYHVVKRSTDIMLEVQNLNKKEDISIDIISNQQFTEDECYRLRQSIKCGLINWLTLGDILEKVSALQEVRDNDWLEAEVERLCHLRDRASDTGRQKEHREYVEKLLHLKSPEERQRRLKKIPKVHSDPNMDIDHGSEEDEGELDDKKQDNYMTPTGNDSSKIELGPISPHKGRYVSNYSCSVIRKSSNTMELSGNISNKTEDTAITGDLVSENTLAQAKTTAKFNDTEKMWLYRDPSGKVQGPFSKAQLRKWSNTGYFPKDLRIWNSTENQDDSILLTFALDRGFEKVIENGFSNRQGVHTSHSSSYSGKIDSCKGSLGMSFEALRFGTAGSNSDISNLPSPPSLSRGFEGSMASHSTLTRQTNNEYNETGALAQSPLPGPDTDTVSLNPSIESNGWSYGSVNTQMVELNNQTSILLQQPIFSQWGNAASSSVHNLSSSSSAASPIGHLPSGPVNQANMQPSGPPSWAQGSTESMNSGPIMGQESNAGWGAMPGNLNPYFGVTAPGNMNISAPETGNL